MYEDIKKGEVVFPGIPFFYRTFTYITLLLFQRNGAGCADTDTSLTSFTHVCLIRVSLAVFHLEYANRTVVHALFASLALRLINGNGKCHLIHLLGLIVAISYLIIVNPIFTKKSTPHFICYSALICLSPYLSNTTSSFTETAIL